MARGTWSLGASLLLFAGLAQAQAGVDWLQSRANADGSFATTTDLATPYQSTSEAVRTLRQFGRSAVVGAAEGFLNAESYHGTEFLARKIVANADAGLATPGHLAELLAAQNLDGGFGELPGYQSRPLDTGYALEALAAAGATTGTTVGRAVAYLLQQQNSDGSWTRTTDAAEVDVTALVIRALNPFRTQFAGIPQALANAGNFLVSERDATGLWAEDFLTAVALLALAQSSSDVTLLTQSADALRARQLADGSWSGDVYSTALALRALRAYDARAAGGTAGAAGGSVVGYVVRAGTGEPIANVRLSLAADTGASAVTNSSGFFVLNGLPVGDQTLLARKAGYFNVSKLVTVRSGQTSDVGQIFLSPEGQSGFVSGLVFDSVNGQPLAGVTVTLSGAAVVEGSTAGDGRFDLGAVAPGSYSVSIVKAGYHTTTGVADVPAGSTLTIRQGLTPEGVFRDESPADLRGRVINGTTDLPASGVQALLGNGQTAVTGSDGTFTLPAVPRGDHTLQLSGSGFETRTYSFNFPPGAGGNLGDLKLYPQSPDSSPTTLTVHGTVIDAVSNAALAGATATLVSTGETKTADADGRFVFSGLTTLSAQFTVSAADHETRTFSLTASGFGDLSSLFPLPPAGGNDTATSSTLSGTVLDSATGAPIAGADVVVLGTALSAMTDGAGAFQVTGIQQLEFVLNVSAAGYFPRDYQVGLTRHGVYQMSAELDPAPDTSRFQIISLLPQSTGTGAGVVQTFAARIVNTSDEPQNALVLAEVLDGTGTSVARVSPYAPGTTVPQSDFGFQPGEELDLVLPWDPALAPPGSYRVIVRVVEPGSISRDLPQGFVLTEAETDASVVGTQSIQGELGFDPPLVQAGTNQSVALSALVVNGGNVPLAGVPVTLTVRDPGNGQTLFTTQATLDLLEVGQNVLVDFGSWVPTKAGDLPVSLVASGVPGQVNGLLYVGDKATGTFTVDRNVVPLGTHTVRGTVALQGVDVRTGTSTDPLFFAVKEAVRKGGEFVAPQAKLWKNNNQCLGCHIQTQSLLGLSSAADKAPIDATAVQFLFNNIATSQQSDGGLRESHPQHTRVQTGLAIWSLTQISDSLLSFRTKYRAANHLQSLMSSSGAETWLPSDHCSAWWCTTSSMNFLASSGISDVLQRAAELGTQTVDDYAITASHDLGVANLQDFEEGPDGRLYYVEVGGSVFARDLGTGQTQTLATGLPNPTYGIAVRSDGTVFVSSFRQLTKISPQGVRTTLLSGTSFSQLVDVVIGPDGFLYVSDFSTRRILKVNDTGQFTALATGGLIHSPAGLSVTPAGDIYVANRDAYNVVKVSPTGSVSVFAEGFSYRPYYLKQAADGHFYAIHLNTSNAGQYTPIGVYRIRPNGYAERIPLPYDSPNSNGINGLGLIGGEPYAGRASDRKVYRIAKQPLATGNLASLRTTLTRIARYELNRHKDGSTNNLIQAWRLITLAETAEHVTDPALTNELNTAITFIANVLRTRQRADGGWGHTTSNASDSLVTSAVGIALDYTNPSVNDPLVRKSITFLLSKQQADKSWPNENGILSTKLASTSFVMAYLPLALERLGGIDVDLNIVMPPDIALSNPTVAPTAQAPTPDGGVAYSWFFQGVTAKEREIRFDLTLADMTYREIRPAAFETFLEFANSFNQQTVRSDLVIPDVTAISDLALSVSTDRPSYPEFSPVAIGSLVSNIGPDVDSGEVHLFIRTADGATVLADLGTYGFGEIAQGGSLTLGSGWNSDAVTRGLYQVYGRLFDQHGRLAHEATTPFEITHELPVVTAAVAADKPVYQSWDNVALTSRVRNVARNASQPASIAEVTVRTPAGEPIFFRTYDVNELPAGGVLIFPGALPLSDALSGDYPVELLVKDQSTREVVASATTVFAVQRDELQGLTGGVTVQHAQVHHGDPNACTDTATNISRYGLSGVELARTLVSLDTGAVISTASAMHDFQGSEQKIDTRGIETEPLALGSYACVLTATLQGRTTQLGSAGFLVIEPPIRLAAELELGDRGRILVLMDGEGSPCLGDEDDDDDVIGRTDDDDDDDDDDDCGDDDDNGDDDNGGSHGGAMGTPEPSVAGQRAFIEQALEAQGWSYTIVTDPVAFAWELRSGDYHAYALLSSQVQLGEGVQKELREAVYRGAGLVEAGGNGRRNRFVDAALGVRVVGTHASVDSVEMLAGDLGVTGVEALALRSRAVRARPRLAAVLGRFPGVTLRTGGDDDDDDDDDECEEDDFDDDGGDDDGGDDDDGDDGDDDEGRCGLTDVAVTRLAYGAGASVYAGYDLLAEATLAGAGSFHAQMLTNALLLVQPVLTQPAAGQVVPLKLTVSNLGIGTAGRALVTLPAGAVVVDRAQATVENGVLVFGFSLAEDEVKSFTAWVRLPEDAGAVRFDASVQTGEAPDVTERATATLELTTGSRPGLAEALSLSTAHAAFGRAKVWLVRADVSIRNGEFLKALMELVLAADEVRKVIHPEAHALRLMIGQAILETGRQL